MFGSLREIMPLPCDRFLIGLRYGLCVENATGRHIEEDRHATVVNCDAHEIWDNDNGCVPFNNGVDPWVTETKDTHHQAQRVLEQAGGGLLFVYQVYAHTSEQRISQMSCRGNRAGTGRAKTKAGVTNLVILSNDQDIQP